MFVFVLLLCHAAPADRLVRHSQDALPVAKSAGQVPHLDRYVIEWPDGGSVELATVTFSTPDGGVPLPVRDANWSMKAALGTLLDDSPKQVPQECSADLGRPEVAKQCLAALREQQRSFSLERFALDGPLLEDNLSALETRVTVNAGPYVEVVHVLQGMGTYPWSSQVRQRFHMGKAGRGWTWLDGLSADEKTKLMSLCSKEIRVQGTQAKALMHFKEPPAPSDFPSACSPALLDRGSVGVSGLEIPISSPAVNHYGAPLWTLVLPRESLGLIGGQGGPLKAALEAAAPLRKK